MKMMSIASGSSGNCIFVGSEKTGVLIDAGISKKRIIEGLQSADISMEDINGIVITHEHIDHVQGLGVISRSYGIPIYATELTIQAIKQIPKLGVIEESLFHPIKPDEPFFIGDVYVEAHAVWHDASDPVSYTLMHDAKKVGIATDLGDYDTYMISSLQNCDALLVEANHDIRMLQAGRYPYVTKQRILSSYGHLCNEAGGRLIRSVLNDHIKAIFLGHLSEENNLPELAYAAVEAELMGNPFTNDVRDFGLAVASRSTPGRLLEL